MTSTQDATVPRRPVAAIYVRVFLTISETFIYRQLVGVCPDFQPIVLTCERQHEDAFPVEYPVFCQKPPTAAQRLYSKMLRFATGRYSVPPAGHVAEWKRIIRQANAGLIHAHFGPGGIDMLPVAEALDLPLLVSFHGYDASRLLRDARYVSHLRRLFRRAHIIVPSRFMRERLVAAGAASERTVVHHYGVSMNDFPYVERIPIFEKLASGKESEFLQVSNFVEKKGHSYTVRAFRELLRTEPRCRLTLVGDGPLRPSIEGLCRDLGIAGNVDFVGKLPNREIRPLLERADVFVHHSVTTEDGDEEGIPNAIIEAMATGLVLISTVHAGIPEVIEDRISGFLVAERDVAAYAARMAAVLAAGNDIGRRAHEKIRADFNLDVQNRRLIDIYVRHSTPRRAAQPG